MEEDINSLKTKLSDLENRLSRIEEKLNLMPRGKDPIGLERPSALKTPTATKLLIFLAQLIVFMLLVYFTSPQGF